MTDVIALDVSMGKSNVAWYQDQTCRQEIEFTHTQTGFNELWEIVQKADQPVIYFESTGVYSRSVERFCRDHQLPFCRLNPLELHLKAEDLRRLKTDRQDARKIALTVQENQFRLTTARSPRYEKLHELNRFYTQLDQDWRHRINQLHSALEQTFPELKLLFKDRHSKLALNVVELFPHPEFIRNLSRTKLKNLLINSTDKKLSNAKGFKYADKLLDFAKDSYPAVDSDAIQVDEVRYFCRQLINLKLQREKIIKQMVELAKQEPAFKTYLSMPGIGDQTAAQLMAELGDITRFDNANQLNAYVGIDIRRYQSGKTQYQDHINKRGNSIARKLLYFAVGNMIRQQRYAPSHIVDFYYRLKEKRPYPKTNKVAMVACMNKTLKCLLTMIKHQDEYHYRYADSRSQITES